MRASDTSPTKCYLLSHIRGLLRSNLLIGTHRREDSRSRQHLSNALLRPTQDGRGIMVLNRVLRLLSTALIMLSLGTILLRMINRLIYSRHQHRRTITAHGRSLLRLTVLSSPTAHTTILGGLHGLAALQVRRQRTHGPRKRYFQRTS